MMKTIKLPREIGIKKARQLYATAAAVLEAGPDCALDFARVTRMDLSAAQTVRALARECGGRGGRFEIKNTDAAAARLLRLAGVGI
jgi:anti-anti-sigma regulatory factor